MKLKLLIVAMVLAAAAGAAALWIWQEQPEWTTRSPAALAEFKLGLDAEMKFYHPDAYRHFTTAIELDRDFVAAKVMLARYYEARNRRDQLIGEIARADLNQLTARERFMARYALAVHSAIAGKPQQVLHDYLREYPEDPFGLEVRSLLVWERQDWELAEKTYKRLLEIDPNWVRAYNHLGYIAMARGHFKEAEDLFRTYLFIAPDQANPNDSLGELLTLLGRYEEAEQALRQAIRIKPDFCSSYEHLVQLAEISGQSEKTPALLAQAKRNQACPADKIEYLSCSAQLWRALFAGDLAAADQTRQSCAALTPQLPVQMQRLAVLSQRFADAEAIENKIRERVSSYAKSSHGRAEFFQADLLHMEGVRLAALGKPSDAAARFREADRLVVYWGDSQGLFKLFNLLHLSEALRRTGNQEAAAAVLNQVRAVNPNLAQRYRAGDFLIP